MGFYSERILPHCIDLACGVKDLVPARQRIAGKLSGTVLEIGFGSGLNLPYLPAAVTHVLAVDPSERARAIGRQRIESALCPVEFVGLDAEKLQLADGVADTALTTFTLCTIPMAEQALREVKRVLKPGGQLFFLEHGRSPDAAVARWQDRLNGMQGFFCGGCQLNRDIPSMLQSAGFQLESLEVGYLPRVPRTHGYIYSGSARF